MDIGSQHNQLSNEQNSAYPSKHVSLCEIFHKKYLSLEKVILMAKFANHYKTVFLKKWPYKAGYAAVKHCTYECDCYSI